MKRFLPTSVRFNLVLVVLFGILPMFALILASGLERRQDELYHAESTTMRLAEFFAFTQENEIRRIKEALTNLAASPPVQTMDIPACNALLKHYLGANPNYVNFALIAPDGEALASALAFKRQNLSERKEIIGVLQTRAFSVGEYSIGKVSGVPILPVAQPVKNEHGTIIGIVLASLRLQDYSRIFEQSKLPPDSFVGLADHKGIRLYYYPAKETNPVGTHIAPAAWKTVQDIKHGGLFTSKGSDGISRVFAVRRLSSMPGSPPYLNIFVGFPKQIVTSKAAAITVRYMGWLLFSLLLSSFFAWYVGKFGIVDRLTRLVSLARRLGEGDMSARSGLTDGGGSLGKLESSLDAMAESLERDIHLREIMEENLRRSRNEAEAANEAKSTFLANMSHEIRTPINGVMGMMVLMQSTEMTAEQTEYTEMSIQACRRLVQLISDILDLSRIEAGMMELRETSFSLEDSLGDVEQLFGFAARQKGLELRFEIGQGIPHRLIGDQGRLQQILNNFVGNALKFTSAGEIVLTAQLARSKRDDEQRILFSVKDMGVGIPYEKVDKLFKPFTQLDGSYTRQFQGAGLGLSIVKRLVQLMDGTLCVESETGVGSTFNVCLPFKIDKSDTGETSAAPDVRAHIPKGLRVLVAEDDKTSALVITRILEKAGCAPQTVENGEKALQAVKYDDFAIVFMDVQMPEMDGVEATHRIRAGEAGAAKVDIPIIALTAYAMTGEQESFLAAGMDAYIAKPVEKDALMRTIHEILNRPRR